MSDVALAWIVVVAGACAAQIPYLLATVLVAFPFFPIERISLGSGPQLLSFRWKGVTLRLAAFLPGSNVTFRADGYSESTYDDPPKGSFSAGPWWQRLICVLAGPLGMIGAAAIILGSRVIEPALAPFPFVGALIESPFAPVEVSGVIAPIARDEGILVAVAMTAAFLGGMQFLPLSFISGGMALTSIAEAFHGRLLPERLMDIQYKLSFGVVLILLGLAAVAIWR